MKKFLIAMMLSISLSGCAFDSFYTKKEQLRLEVDPALMAPPKELQKL